MYVKKLDRPCGHAVCLQVALLVVKLDRSFEAGFAYVPRNSLDEVYVLFVHLDENFLEVVGTHFAFFLTKNVL